LQSILSLSIKIRETFSLHLPYFSFPVGVMPQSGALPTIYQQENKTKVGQGMLDKEDMVVACRAEKTIYQSRQKLGYKPTAIFLKC